MLETILWVTAAWLGATALFVGVPMWRAFRREPLRRYAFFVPRASGALPPVQSEVWVEWWKAFGGIAGSGRGRVLAVRERAVTIDVDGRAIEFHPSRFGSRAATGRAIVDGMDVSAVVVTSARS
ncbi:MAG TPA: hypothetical protein VGF48_10165 [Thermoanaerobaculia bacterium]|jgi:hypothetical protein